MFSHVDHVVLHEQLAVVTVGLFGPDSSANALIEQYKPYGDDDTSLPWRPHGERQFDVLLPTDEVKAFAACAARAGHEILAVAPVTTPGDFGDGEDAVSIAKHGDGWIVLQP